MTYHLPPRFAAIVDAAVADDGDFFEQHPTENARIRRVVPGEFHPHSDPRDEYVYVRQIARGVRIRHPFRLVGSGAAAMRRELEAES